MFSSHTAHKISFYIGFSFLYLSIIQALFVKESQFYTSFVLGSWLVLDFIDYKLNKTSILSYFYNHKHRFAFYLFFFVSFIFCFIVDYLWGVRVFKMWEWINYGFVQFFRMYVIMNASFVLGMYELYRLIKTLLKTKIKEKNIIYFKFSYEKKHTLYLAMFLLGIIFIFLPLYFLLFNIYYFAEFVMILPFISVIFITDAITYLTGGEPILEDLIHFNMLKVISLLLTVLIAVVITEGLNLSGKEWRYLQMPFYNMQIFTVPASVVIGWIPLIIGSISIVNMVKHVSFIKEKR
ncbi:MAG: hypothetical protein Q7K55_06715 [Candidatus Levybacteria bacterium]|nr:hypothetical protein [Candidatus Levybacteria bacterium]